MNKGVERSKPKDRGNHTGWQESIGVRPWSSMHCRTWDYTDQKRIGYVEKQKRKCNVWQDNEGIWVPRSK